MFTGGILKVRKINYAIRRLGTKLFKSGLKFRFDYNTKFNLFFSLILGR